MGALLFSVVAVAAEPPQKKATIIRKADTAHDRLEKHLEVLRNQKLIGQGRSVERRYQEAVQKAEEAFIAKDYEKASLIYSTIVENPEFSKVMLRDEVEYRLIQSLYHAHEDYSSLDYIERTLQQPERSPYFVQVFRILVDVLNRVRDWDEMQAIMESLKEQRKSLPPVAVEEANYLFGRMAFFKDDLTLARSIFSAISSKSRFYSRALYHLGVISAIEGKLSEAERFFRAAYDDSKSRIDFKISDIEGKQEDVIAQKAMFQDVCLLAINRIEYTQGADASYSGIIESSESFPNALFERAWAHFSQKRYKEALGVLEKFTIRFPNHALYPETILLGANTNMEMEYFLKASQEFNRFVARYQPVLGELNRLSKVPNASEAFRQFNANAEIAARPELSAWVFYGPKQKAIREFLLSIDRGKTGVQKTEEGWGGVKSLLGEGDKQVLFPAQSNISKFGGRDRTQEGVSRKQKILEELKGIEREMKLRVTDLEINAQKMPEKKRKDEKIEQAIAEGKQQLKAVQEKINRIKKDLDHAVVAKPSTPIKKEGTTRQERIKQFDNLVDEEKQLLPAISKSLEEKRVAFQEVSARIVQKYIGLLATELGNSVRFAYLGEIENAFLEMKKTKGDVDAAQTKITGLINTFLKRYPSAPEVPDQMFRLAEIAYDRSKRTYFKAQEAFEAQYELFRKGTLKKEPVEPKADYSESIAISKKILAQYPSFKSRDRVLYVLGYYYDEQGLKQESIASFQQLINEFPKSEYAPEGYMRIAENWFALRKFKNAIDNYKFILNFPDSIFYEISLYKIAWSNYLLGQYNDAIDYFTKLITLKPWAAQKYEDEALEMERRRRSMDLRNEALTYLALSFSEAGGPKAVIAHFERLKLKEYTVEVLRRLSDIYYQQLRHPEAIESIRVYLQYAPFVADGPQYQSKIIDCYEKMGESESAFAERQRLADLFGPRSAWWQKNIRNVSAIKEAKKLVEDALIYSATLFHERAQRLGAQKEKADLDESRRSYTLAIEAYKRYLLDFSDSPQAYEMRFNYAESLYSVGSYELAAVQYQTVAKANLKDGKYLKDAAFNTILSYENLLKQTGFELDQEISKKPVMVVPEPGAAQMAVATSGKPITGTQQKLVAAYDQFVTWLPKADKVPEVTFKAALIHYHAENYGEAVNRFDQFVKRYPKHQFTPSAVNYTLVAFFNQRQWANVEAWSRRILADVDLQKSFKPEEIQKLLAVSILYQGEQLTKQAKYAEASQKLLTLDREFKANPFAAMGMYQAALVNEKAGKDEESIKILDNLVKNYPKSEWAPKSLFLIGRQRERSLKFDEAALAFERLAHQYPQSEQAADSLFNAALFLENIGQDKRAAQNYLEYATRYPNQKDVGEIHFLSAKAFERAGDYPKALKMYLEQAEKYKAKVDREIECYARAADIYQKMNDEKQYEKTLGKAVAAFKKGPNAVGDGGRYFATKARFLQGEAVFKNFEAIELKPPQKRLVKSLEDKAYFLERANKIYVDAVSIGDAEWAIAALYKIGRGYQLFSEALFESPLPQGLTGKAAEEYKAQLEDQAFPVEEKAIEAYERGLKKAVELGAYGIWTERILNQLRAYRPSIYPAVQEQLPAIQSKSSVIEGNFLEIP